MFQYVLSGAIVPQAGGYLMVPTITLDQDSEKLHVPSVGTPPRNLQDACDESCTRSVDIDAVTDGREAIQRLTTASECDSSVDHTRPDLVLLQFDFELPDGMTVLHAIKSSPRLDCLTGGRYELPRVRQVVPASKSLASSVWGVRHEN